MLTSCKACGKQVDNTAKVCPHCGVDKPGEKRNFRGIGCFLLVVIIIALIGAIFGKKEPVQRPKTKQEVKSTSYQQKQNEIENLSYQIDNVETTPLEEPSDTRDTAIELLKTGMSVKEIAKETGLSKHEIRQLKRQLGKQDESD